MYCFLATQISLLINQRNPQTSSHENKTTNPLAEKKKRKSEKKGGRMRKNKEERKTEQERGRLQKR